MAEELFKSVEIDGERYTIKKFTALTGLQIAKMIIAKAEPLVPVLEKGLDSDEVADAIFKMAENISDEDLRYLINKCLRNCYKALPAGLQPVIDNAGNYGVDGIEYNLKKTIRLCYEAISWGASDFFGEGGLISDEAVKGLIGRLPRL